MTLKEIQEKLRKYQVPVTLSEFQKFYSENFRILRKMIFRNEISDWCEFLNISPMMIITMNDSDIERRILTQHKFPAHKISRIFANYLQLPDRQKRVHFNLQPQKLDNVKRLKGGESNLWEIFDYIKQRITDLKDTKKKQKECRVCPDNESKKIKYKCKCKEKPENTNCGFGHFYDIMTATACPPEIKEIIHRNDYLYDTVNEEYNAEKDIVSDTDTENDFCDEIKVLNDSKAEETIRRSPTNEYLNSILNSLGLQDMDFSSETDSSDDEGNCCNISRKLYKNLLGRNSGTSTSTNSSTENIFIDSSEHSISSTENSYNNDSCGYNNSHIGHSPSMENVNDLCSDSSSDCCSNDGHDDDESDHLSELSDSSEDFNVNCICEQAKYLMQEKRNNCSKERKPNFANIKKICKELERPEQPELRLSGNLYELHKCITEKPNDEFGANECSIICKSFINRSMKVPKFKKSRNVYENE